MEAPRKIADRFFTHGTPRAGSRRPPLSRPGAGSPAEFARRAFRRPVDERQINRLTDLAESVYSEPQQKAF